MIKNLFKYCFFIVFLFLNISASFSQESKKIVIVIIDGARHTETFGDPTHQFIPEMWEIAQEGTIIDNYYNNGITYTYRAIPALWCGAWTPVIDTTYMGVETQYTRSPTLFEYYRKQKNMTEYDCIYVLKYIYSLWLPSFDENYGPDYWPMFHSYGSNDLDVLEQTLWVMDVFHPNLLLVYLGDTDHEGHSGIWENYTSAIYTADSIVGAIWDKIREDPNYKDQTLLFVTNDHGRHDDEHGGFQHHGDGCEGCRHIQFLAAGPTIRKNYVSTKERSIPDMAVTASHWLEINPEMATGQVMHEIFEESAVEEAFPGEVKDLVIFPNPVSEHTKLSFNLKQATDIQLRVYDVFGHEIIEIKESKLMSGEHEVNIGVHFGEFPAGIYLYSLVMDRYQYSGKIIKGNN